MLLISNPFDFFNFWLNTKGEASSKDQLFLQAVGTLTPGAYPYPQELVVTQMSPLDYQIYIPQIKGQINNSKSIYIQDINVTYQLGRDFASSVEGMSGRKKFLIILNFGEPAYDKDKNVYGSYLFDPRHTFAPLTSIEQSVGNFIDGYCEYFLNKSRDPMGHIDLAVGFNNARNVVMQDYNHRFKHATETGWAVNHLDVASLNDYGDFVRVSGAMDMEHDPRLYSDADPSRSWLETFSSAAIKPFYNFGTADCDWNSPEGNEQNYIPSMCGPNIVLTPGAPPLTWDQEDVVYVSYLGGWAYPFPEVYSTNGINAKQWYRIGILGSMKGTRLIFRGTLTQYTACLQRIDSDCPWTNNSPGNGYDQMLMLVSGDNRLTNEMKWASDIMYQSEPTLTPTPTH